VGSSCLKLRDAVPCQTIVLAELRSWISTFHGVYAGVEPTFDQFVVTLNGLPGVIVEGIVRLFKTNRYPVDLYACCNVACSVEESELYYCMLCQLTIAIW
jgi:hypothetical protein